MMLEVVHDLADDLRLDRDELRVLTVMQQVMLERDLIAEKNAERRAAKTRFRDAFAQAAVAAHWSRTDELPDWAREFAAAIAARVPAQQRPAIETASTVFGAQVERRSRALLLLIELVAFEPWADLSWVPGARRAALAAVAGRLWGLRRGDLDAVAREYAAVARALSRRNVRWGRVAAASAAGLAARGAAQDVAHAAKLDVVTRLVIVEAEGDDEKARLVVEGLQTRLDEVRSTIHQLTEQLRVLTADDARLSTEDELLRRELQAERDAAELVETALQVVVDRIPSTGCSGGACATGQEPPVTSGTKATSPSRSARPSR